MKTRIICVYDAICGQSPTPHRHSAVSVFVRMSGAGMYRIGGTSIFIGKKKLTEKATHYLLLRYKSQTGHRRVK